MDKEQNHIKDLSNYIFATYNVRYNILTHELELNGNPITDLDKNSIYIDCKEKFKRVIKVDVLSILESNLTPKFNPLVSFFESMPIDKTFCGNITKLTDCILSDTENHDMFIKKWLVAMIRSAYDGKHSPLTLILCGGQNTGKTEFFRRLLPVELASYHAESKLDNGKDDEILMTKKLIILDDEMSGKSKKEEAHIKAVTSKQTYDIRPPYKTVSIKMNRLAMLCGTTNEIEILNDITGNRRFLPISVKSINHSLYNSINKKELLYECFTLYKNGYDPDLSKEEITTLNKSTSQFEAVCTIQESICKLYSLPTHETPSHKIDYLTTTQILHQIKQWFSIQVSPNKLGTVLRQLGFTSEQKRINGHKSRCYSLITQSLG